GRRPSVTSWRCRCRRLLVVLVLLFLLFRRLRIDRDVYALAVAVVLTAAAGLADFRVTNVVHEARARELLAGTDQPDVFLQGDGPGLRLVHDVVRVAARHLVGARAFLFELRGRTLERETLNFLAPELHHGFIRSELRLLLAQADVHIAGERPGGIVEIE